MYFDRGEVITSMRRKRATKFVTSDEMTLCKFYGAILLFRNENQYTFVFNQNYSDFFYHVISSLKHGTLVITQSINPQPLSALELTLSSLIMGFGLIPQAITNVPM